jgi:hypothetical protein
VSIFLSLDDNVGRNALVTHSFGVGFVVFAIFIDLVAHLGRREAVIAFYLKGMDALAFQFALFEPVIEGNVGSIRDELFVKAMHAFGIGTVLAKHL